MACPGGRPGARGVGRRRASMPRRRSERRSVSTWVRNHSTMVCRGPRVGTSGRAPKGARRGPLRTVTTQPGAFFPVARPSGVRARLATAGASGAGQPGTERASYSEHLLASSGARRCRAFLAHFSRAAPGRFRRGALPSALSWSALLRPTSPARSRREARHWHASLIGFAARVAPRVRVAGPGTDALSSVARRRGRPARSRPGARRRRACSSGLPRATPVRRGVRCRRASFLVAAAARRPTVLIRPSRGAAPPEPRSWSTAGHRRRPRAAARSARGRTSGRLGVGACPRALVRPASRAVLVRPRRRAYRSGQATALALGFA
jgi:hypothetical protein